jgi:DNA-binding transcriptional ArsR family regulator
LISSWNFYEGVLFKDNSNVYWSQRWFFKEVCVIVFMEETYLNVDLNDDRAKYIAEVLGNKTCKKILELLARKDLTVTDIAKELDVPLNTVDYNIKKLIKSGLIEQVDYFWSVKGKKMPVYRVANKKIVISPRDSFIKKTILPSFLISLFGGLGVYLVGRWQTTKTLTKDFGKNLAEETFDMVSAPMVNDGGQVFQLAGWQWFVGGFIICLLISILFFYIRNESAKKVGSFNHSKITLERRKNK